MNTSLSKGSFDLLLGEEASFEDVKRQLTKAGKVRQSRSSPAQMSVPERLAQIDKEVTKILGRYNGFVRCIRDPEEFHRYISRAIEFGEIAVDTETDNSLDPLTCKIMGLCLYIRNTKPVYIPVNHTKPETNILLPNQISEGVLRIELERLIENGVKIIYHNGKFDIRVIWNTCGVRLPVWWDTMIAAQLIDENELAKLKYQYKVHVDPTIGSYNIESLFSGIPYAWVNPDTFALYAAIDSYDTFRLQRYQQSVFEDKSLERLYALFRNIEIPIVSVTAEMEDYGICVDLDVLSRLDVKYKALSQKYLNEIDSILAPHRQEIAHYQRTGKLDNPINFDSPKQLEIVLYDILRSPVNEETGRSTDKDTLKALKSPFASAMLNYRHYNKLVVSFTEPLPKWVSPKDGRLHASFNQMGKEENNVRTGRFSSSDPNLQQIPSSETTFRLMFKASPGHCIIGADFSAQEPRMLAHMADEPTLKKTFAEGRDPYATISQFVFHKDYWECMEHHEDGTPNPDGKKLRKKAKGIMLGVMYGMGAKHMAVVLGVDIEECKKILAEFEKMFPRIKEFTSYNEKFAKENGYVEDYLGRIRHLPDAMKEELEVHAKRKVATDANVFFDCTDADCLVDIPDAELTAMWTRRYHEFMDSGKWSAKNDFKKLAAENKIDLFDNGAFISKTSTQCTNSRIQGSAASLTKKAMIAIANDPIMKECGFHIMLPVHDELLGECPLEHRDTVEKRLPEIMIAAGIPECSVRMKCDTYMVCHWYADEVFNKIHDSFLELTQKGMSVEDAYNKVKSGYSELKDETILAMCYGNFDVLTEEV